MSKYIKVPIEKLWHGFASVRSYKVEKAKQKRKGLDICLNKNKHMYVEYKDLDKHFKNNYKLKSSRVPGQVYDLYDYDWKPNKNAEEQLQFNIFDSLYQLHQYAQSND